MSVDCSKVKILQIELLKIYEVVRTIFDRHQIRYYASGGTAIGAMRHRGFIPWDDDLDLEVPRDDYERLPDILKDELPDGFVYLSHANCLSYHHLFSKVVCSDESYVRQIEAKTGFNLGEGLFIDLFPSDYFPRSKFSQVVRLSRRAWSKILQKTVAAICGRSTPLFHKTLLMDERAISSCPSDRAGKEYFSTWFIDDWRMFCGKINVDKADYGEPRLVPFEQTTIPVMANVENYLTQQFGAWQIPPPENCRNLSHGQAGNQPWRFGPTKGAL